MIRTYIVKVEMDDPETDLSLVMRETVSFMSDLVAPGGGSKVIIDVTDHEGNVITGHYYDPDEMT